MTTSKAAVFFHRMDRLFGGFNFIITQIVGILLVVIFVLLMTQVGMRYVVRYPLSWIEELTAFLAAFMVIWGASVCLRNGSHVIVDTFYEMYPENVRRVVTVFIYVLALYFAYALFIGGMRLAQLGAFESSSSGTFIMYWPRLAIGTGAVLIGIQAANLLIQEVASWFTGVPYYAGIRRHADEFD